MTHWIYLATIATISKGLLNKVTLHHSSFELKFPKLWIKCLCVHCSSIIHLFDDKKINALHLNGFLQKSLIVAWFTFNRFKFKNLMPSTFKNQTNDTFKPLGNNCNHQQGFLKEKIVSNHRCCFNWKFP